MLKFRPRREWNIYFEKYNKAKQQTEKHLCACKENKKCKDVNFLNKNYAKNYINGENMEIWDLYDENGNKLNLTHKRGDDIPDNCFHLVVHIWIKNKQNKYLITKRASNRESFPNFYETVGGSVLQNETTLQAAVREVREEIGLKINQKSLKIFYNAVRKEYMGKKYNDILTAYIFDYNGEVDLDAATTDEVSSFDWLDLDEVKKLQDDGLFVPSHEYVFEAHKKLQNNQEKLKKIKKNKQKSKYNRDKSKYFNYYADITHGSHNVIDW